MNDRREKVYPNGYPVGKGEPWPGTQPLYKSGAIPL